MIVNELSLQLIRESLFYQQMERSDQLVSRDTWEKVYKELQCQAVLGIISDDVLRKNSVPEEIREEWRLDRYNYLWKYSQVAEVQKKVCETLE